MADRYRPSITEIDADDVDDFDFPLPSQPSPSLASKPPPARSVPIQQAREQQRQKASTANSPFPSSSAGLGGGPTIVNDDSKFKRWTCVYPIYLDAKRKCNVNERRIPREKSCMWPVAEEMAKAATKLGLMTVYEPNKSHPSDWNNPGRIRVLLKDNGGPVHPVIKDKRTLILRISMLLQPHQSQQVPPLPPTASSRRKSKKTPTATKSAKPDPKDKQKPVVEPSATTSTSDNGRPPIEKRLPLHSPAISPGILEYALANQKDLAAGLPGSGAAAVEDAKEEKTGKGSGGGGGKAGKGKRRK